MKTRSLRDQWSSRLTFILAATGSAVGLVNMEVSFVRWKASLLGAGGWVSWAQFFSLKIALLEPF